MNTRLIAERGRRLERPLHRVGEQRRGRPSAGTAGKKKGPEWGINGSANVRKLAYLNDFARCPHFKAEVSIHMAIYLLISLHHG